MPGTVSSIRGQNLPAGELNAYLYSHWGEELKKQLSSRLGRNITYISHYHQLRLKVDGEIAYYAFRLFAGENADDDRMEDLVAVVRMDFYEDTFEVVHLCRHDDFHSSDLALPGIDTDQHLIPKLYNDALREKEAERFLSIYCPEALESPMPVPIRKIMEEQMGLRVKTGYNLPKEEGLGFTVFEGQAFDLTEDGTAVTPYLLRGTVVVDSDTALLYGIGMMNFTLAHEAYHWFAHRAYMDFHRSCSGSEGAPADEGASSYNGSSRYSAGDILEIQANTMASRILLPKEPFTEKFRELSERYPDIHTVIASLAAFFKVSYSAVTYHLAGLDLVDFTAPSSTTEVTAFDAYRLFEDPDFRELVEDCQIVYAAGHYVYNDPKFVKLIWDAVPTVSETRMGGPYQLTEYALSHPEEAFVTFSIDHKRIAEDMESGVLRRESDEKLIAQVDWIRKKTPEIGKEMQKHADAFTEYFEKEKGRHLTFCQLARLMITWRYGRMEDFDPAAEERDIDGVIPEKYEETFSANSWLDFLERERNRIWDSDDPFSVTEIKEKVLDKEITKEQQTEDDIRYQFYANLAVRTYDENTGLIFDEASSPIDLFCSDTLQPRSAYTKIMNGKSENPEIKKLMCLCVGLCLSRDASALLFRSAGRILTWDKENLAYRYILTHMRGEYIENVNIFLDDIGLKPLGSGTNTGAKNKASGG